MIIAVPRASLNLQPTQCEDCGPKDACCSEVLRRSGGRGGLETFSRRCSRSFTAALVISCVSDQARRRFTHDKGTFRISDAHVATREHAMIRKFLIAGVAAIFTTLATTPAGGWQRSPS